MSSVGINNGMCRCCASEGTFKDVKTPYNWMGVEEIYYDMLQECFDIHLTSVEDSDNGGICEVCITQLRNAANFKKQVLHTEEQFKLRLEGKFFKGDEVKIEAMDKESDAMDFGRDSDDNTSDNDRMETEVLFAEGYEELPIKSESEDVKPKKRTTRASTSKAKKSKSSDGESSTKHEDKRCQICNRAFTKMFNLNRHIRTKHDTERVATMKKLCDGCGKVFINSEYLAKHLAIGCLSKTKLCVKCDKHFDRKSDMYKHMRAKHWCGSKLSKFHCPLCEEVLKCHEEHDKHLSSEHDVNLEYQEMEFLNYEDLIEWKENIEKNDGVCFPKRSSRLGYYYHCYPTKYLSSSRFRGKPYICPARIEFIEQGQRILASYQSTHLCERENSRKIEKARVFCPLCEVKLDSYEELNGHLLEHNIEVGVENFSFTSFEDFHEWKSKMEKETIQFFTRSSTIHTNKSRTEGIKAVRRSYYFCTAFKNKPKANKTCPARFTLTIEGINDFKVIYQSTHVGHDLNSHFTKLTKKERLYLAKRLKNGDNIVDIITEAKETADPRSKLKVLKRADLHNIIRDFNIDKSLVNYGSVYNKSEGLEECVESDEEVDNTEFDCTESKVNEVEGSSQSFDGNASKMTKIYILKLKKSEA